MIHRAPFGSMERFVAILIEHCAGNFPLWLTPDQVIILTVSEKYNDDAHKLLNVLNNYDIRGLVDDRNERVGKKIRDAEIKKVPFMIVLGEEEVKTGSLAIRRHGEGDIGKLSAEKFAELINKEIEEQLKQ